jgi:hypothetical protein
MVLNLIVLVVVRYLFHRNSICCDGTNTWLTGSEVAEKSRFPGVRQMLSKALKTLVAVAVVLSSTGALATLTSPGATAMRLAQPDAHTVGIHASGTHNPADLTAYNDVDVAFATRARTADRAESAATGLPELDNWMLLAAGGVLILMVTQRRMRNVND